ncbi:MAG TPA: MFS transporter [Gemmataceae bacterium]
MQPEPTPAPDAPTAAPRKAVFIVFLVIFIDLLGFGIVLPLLPRIADEYLAPAGVSATLSGFLIGVLFSSFSLMQFVFAPLWGRLSDRAGRRPILLIGLGGSVVFYTLFGLASELPPEQAWAALGLLLLSRAGAGVAGATIATAQAVIADSTPPHERKRGMALIGAAFGIGFTFGPLIAYAAVVWFPELRGGVGYVAAALSLVAFILAVRLLPETRRPGAPSAARRSWLDMHGLYRTLRTPAVGLLVLIFFLATFAFANFEATLALLTKAFGYTDDDNFLIFAYVGALLMVAQGVVYRRLAKRLDEVSFVRIGLAIIFIGLANLAGVAVVTTGTMPGDWHLTWFLLTLACAVFGFAFLTPSVQALISRRTAADRQGEVLGVNQSFAALARILGPLIGLTLFGSTETHMLPYVFAAALLAVVLLLVPRIGREEAEPGPEGNGKNGFEEG